MAIPAASQLRMWRVGYDLRWERKRVDEGVEVKTAKGAVVRLRDSRRFFTGELRL